MKTIILLITLMLSISAFAQTVYVDSLANGADTVFTQRVNQTYPFWNVIVEAYGTHAIIADVKVGTLIPHPTTPYVYIDTVWYNVEKRDSAGAIATNITLAPKMAKLLSIRKIFPQLIKVWLTTNNSGDKARIVLEGLKEDWKDY